MKRLFCTFLMFIMLMPGLACGPFMGAAKAQAARPTMEMAMPGCKGMGMKAGTVDHGFFKDCAKIDLHGTHHADLQKPDIGQDFVFAAWDGGIPANIFSPARIHVIRGPPQDRPDLSQKNPPILLTTQRFRE